jgi:hypothetical protein
MLELSARTSEEDSELTMSTVVKTKKKNP